MEEHNDRRYIDRRRGELLREIRVRRMLTQEQLEKASGVPQAAISRYENGQDMFVRYAAKLAKALGVSIDEMVGLAPRVPAGDGDLASDPYPNRRRLRALPEFKEAPAEVRAFITRHVIPSGDLDFGAWFDRLRFFKQLHEEGSFAPVVASLPKPAHDTWVPRRRGRPRGPA